MENSLCALCVNTLRLCACPNALWCGRGKVVLTSGRIALISTLQAKSHNRHFAGGQKPGNLENRQ